MGEINKYFKGQWSKLCLLLLMTILSGMLIPLSQNYLRKVIDFVAAGKIEKEEVMLFAAMNLLMVVAPFVSNLIEVNVDKIVGTRIAYDVMKKGCKVQFETLESPEKRDLIQLLRENPEEFVLEYRKNILDILAMGVELIGFSIIICKASFLLMVILVVLLLAVFLLTKKSMEIMNEMFKHQSRAEREVAEYEYHLKNKDSLSVLKVYDGLSLYFRKYKNSVNIIKEERIKTTWKANRYSTWDFIISGIWIIASIVLSIWYFYKGRIGIGYLCVLINSFVALLSISESFSFALSTILENRFRVKQLEKYLKLPEIEVIEDNHTNEEAVIVFDNVFFHYPNSETMVLKGVSFVVKKGEKVSLVGQNGCGKTTILMLLLGLYEPSSGHIYLLGKDIASYTQKEKAEILSVVFQDYARFQLSTRDNVSLANLSEKYNNDRIRNALMQAKATNLVECDYDRELGKMDEGALELSGGQWQRVAIARALFAESDILLFDEPLAAADPIQEANMYDRLQVLAERKTTLIISHRMGAVKKSSRVLVLDDGVIVEDGSPDKLLARKVLFNKFYTMQSSWYKKEEET